MEGPADTGGAFLISTGADADVCGHAVTPAADRIVYATKNEVVCVRRDGAHLWRYDLLPQSSEKFGHRPGCAFSSDGTLLWVYRPDAMAGRGNSDTWVVLDADSGEVLAQTDLGSVGHGGEHFPWPAGTGVLLDVGEGQDGALVFLGDLKGTTLDLVRYPWDTRCLIALAPGGGQFMSVDHGQLDVAFHDHPSGEVVLTLPIQVLGHDPEDARVEWSGGYLDAETAIVTVGGETEDDDVPVDEREWHRHYRVDLRTGEVVGEFDGHSGGPYDLEPLGDGSWLTSDPEGGPVRWKDGKQAADH